MIFKTNYYLNKTKDYYLKESFINKFFYIREKMGVKEKLIGLVLIVLGVWPFLLRIEAVEDFFSSYKFLEVLTPGEIIFQIVLIVLGVVLIWRFRLRGRVQPNQ